MNILHTRRIAQLFFLLLFTWFCIVSTVGEHWHQLRGWPINWFLQLDPLTGLGTLLTTHKLYAGLLWGAFTLVLTILVGRFFCGWVCPLGALQQFFGWLNRRQLRIGQRRSINQYHPAQALKYYLLFALLAAAAVGLLQTGLLDPIPLLHRSVNLLLLPLAQGATRLSLSLWSLAIVFLALLLSCLWIPRFYCRFVCPLGALFGLLVRWTPWRIGKRNSECTECSLCEADCEGACAPFGNIRLSECLLCLNCLKPCRHEQMVYGPHRSAAGELPSPRLSRRGFLAGAALGLAAPPVLRLGGSLDNAWSPAAVRPPGALAEHEFLERCLKCGQCMRVCPTNTLQPALTQAGWAGLWTPVLNFRVGTSGCQLNCIACGNVCPTAAIRPITLDEKLGRGAFAQAGPLRIGTAFVDRARCLPWAMDVPCIVCQENCPVSPKAIFLREEFQVIREGTRIAQLANANTVTLDSAPWAPGMLGTGSHYLRLSTPGQGTAPASSPGGDVSSPTSSRGGDVSSPRFRIADNSPTAITVIPGSGWASPAPGSTVFIEVALQKPFVDPTRCTGCGICEHECPVSGLRAIRVTAENESRNHNHSLLTKT